MTARIGFDPGRHTYTLDGAWIPSVTGIIGCLDKPWMKRWAASQVANYVVDNITELPADLAKWGRDGLVSALVKVPDRTSGQAMARGTEVHALAESLIFGAAVEVPPELAGMVTGYADFLDAWNVVPLFTECMVAHERLAYAGRFDLIARIEDEVWMLDNKTGKNPYPETALQCAAYARADFLQIPDQDATWDIPDIDRIGVLHITHTGTNLYDLGDIDTAFREFRAARASYEGIRRRARLIGDPLTPPVAQGVAS